MTNPFIQRNCWQLTFDVPMEAALAMEEAFADGALATASFEQPHNPAHWSVQVWTEHAPDWQGRARHVAQALGIALAEPEVKELQPQDWQPHLARDFPPLHLGRFFVHGGHAKGQLPANAWGVQVEAGMAFGSGEHATTAGCLLLLDRLARQRHFSSILDMGCGSGILAIAAARAWPQARILGIDSDAASARIAQENMRINKVRHVKALAGNGYASRAVHAGAPYDLIVANILARPLVSMAPDLRAHLAPGGLAVLSGLLAHQQPMVLSAHRAQGLTLRARILRQGWAALLLGLD